MKSLTIIAILLLLVPVAGAQTMGVSAGHDLDALWARAQANYDLAAEDAVILLDSRTVTVGDEGQRVTRVHQVVWIGTAQGIRAYADLRVPWNAANSTFEVERLRTWRGDRWWPDAERVSDTAVVHTLPYAVAKADDYTVLRETMLLHDGVELPCIMETSYTIACQGPPTAGADDLYVLPGRDPVVRSEYVLRVRPGTAVDHVSLNGAPEPVVSEGDALELAWTMDGAGAQKLPLRSQPEAFEPTIAWSTWGGNAAMLETFDEAVEGAATLEAALADSVAAVIRGLPAGLDRVEAVVAFVNRSVRPVHTGLAPWLLAPRAAVRTFDTGYGHDLDRAVLLSALLSAPGVDVVIDGPAVELMRPGFFAVSPEVARLADVSGVRVGFRCEDGLFYVDGDGTIHAAGWYADRTPLAAQPGRRALFDGAFLVDLTLEPGADAWTGSGRLRLVGSTAGPGNAALSAGGSADVVKAAVGSILPGLEVTDVRPSAMVDGAPSALRFGFTLPAPEADADGRLVLQVGPADHGPLADLPHDVNASDQARQSPVDVGPAFVQRITLRVRLVGHETIGVPASAQVENAAGTWRLDASRDGDWLTVARSVSVHGRIHEPDAWPDLRALLLEEQDPAHGRIVLKAAE